MELLLHLVVVVHETCAGKSLDTSHACCNSGLGNDLEGRNRAGIRNMGSAAELCGEISHLYYADTVAVLLAKERHSSCLLGLFQTHNVCHNRKRRSDLIVYHLLYLCNLLWSHGREMGKVKAESVACHKGTSLLYMRSQNRAQSFVKQVGSRVVSACQLAVFLIYLESHLISDLEHALCDSSHMAHLAALKLNGILYLELAALCADHADICLLAAHGSVERSFLYDNRSVLAVCEGLCQLVLCSENRNLRLVSQSVVTYELCGDRRIDGLVNGHIGSHVVGRLSGRSGCLFLLFHAGGETVLVYRKILLLQNFLGQVNREAVSIVEHKRILAGEYLLALLCHLGLHLAQDGKSLVNGLVELVLFLCENLENHLV